MCPACITTAVLFAAGGISSGGLTAFIVRTLLRREVAVRGYSEKRAGSKDAQQHHHQGEDQ
jgi:hypothetical protein